MQPTCKIRGFLLRGWLEQSRNGNHPVAGQQWMKSQECLSGRDTANKGARHNISEQGWVPKRDEISRRSAGDRLIDWCDMVPGLALFRVVQKPRVPRENDPQALLGEEFPWLV